jgi:hypothetical protein
MKLPTTTPIPFRTPNSTIACHRVSNCRSAKSGGATMAMKPPITGM